jgi:hypothetical protein
VDEAAKALSVASRFAAAFSWSSAALPILSAILLLPNINYPPESANILLTSVAVPL